MRKMLLVLMLAIAPALMYAETIDQALAQEMERNPQQLHVLVLFKDRLTPEAVQSQLGLRGDDVEQVVAAYRAKTKNQFHWFEKYVNQKSRSKVKMTVHELLQGVSLLADAQTITEISQQEDVERVMLYTEESSKPDTYFLRPEYYRFKEMTIVAVGDCEEKTVEPVAVDARLDVDIDKIINILKKIYDFIKENQPVVNTSIDQACAIPAGITNWQQMAGWREKHTGQYEIKYVNLYGITVVSILVRVHFYHSGNYNGVGRYITCATASIDDLSVLWGYTLNANVSIPDSGIVNIGTSSAPVAGMKMFVQWKVSTIVQNQQGNMTFSLDGNGGISAY